jgi:hypothetical protein
MSKPKETTDSDRQKAQAMIDHLIANPAAPRSAEVPRHENFSAMSILQDINGFRLKLATERGMTLDEWLAAEDKVQHPRSIVPVVPSERTMARRRMVGAGVPDKFIGDVIDRLVADCQPMRDVRAFLGSGDGFRILAGGKGTRKTGSACWALGQLDGGAFLHARDVTRLSINDRDKWERINQAPIVVLDDLGTEAGDTKGAFVSALSELIDRAYSRSRRLIITCNLTPATFKATYGEREYDRLREVGKWSTIAGESVRRYGGDE